MWMRNEVAGGKMKKLAALFVMSLSLLTGTGVAAQNKPQEGRNTRIHEGRMGERGQITLFAIE